MPRLNPFQLFIFALIGAQLGGFGLSAPHDAFFGNAREPASLRMKSDRNSGNGITVMPMNSRFPASELKADGYQVFDLRQRLREDALVEPEPRERDELFRAAGASAFVSRLDQLDRSFLFLRAQEYSAPAFARAYPRLSARVRDQLQAAAKAWGR